MNKRTIAHILGQLLLFLAATMTIPILLALCYQEPGALAFLSSGVITGIVGITLKSVGKEHDFTHREAFAVVTSSWILVAVLGGLPFYLGGSLPTYMDGIFEAMSGITTTGGTVYTAVEGVPHAFLFWRSFLHWIGGMGFIVLAIAVLPKLNIGGRELFQTEVPGPVPERIRPRIKQTAATLWVIYAGMSLVQTMLLMLGGMNTFEALLHTFGTMGTGGFSTRNLSIESYHSPYIEMVILAFMIMAGANFSLYYEFIRTRSLRTFWRSSEFRTYLAILGISTLIIGMDIWRSVTPSLLHAMRLSSFQTGSIMTTTGFSTANFDTWPSLSRLVLLLLMLIGGSAGSTGGAIKVVRLVLVCKYIYRELIRLVHPRAIRYVTLDGHVVDERVISSVLGFVIVYLFLFASGTLAMSAFGLDPVSAASSVAATLGNIGPGLGSVGPYSNYAFLPSAAKALLSFMMLAGRLEIYSVLVLLLPDIWRHRTTA